MGEAAQAFRRLLVVSPPPADVWIAAETFARGEVERQRSAAERRAQKLAREYLTKVQLKQVAQGKFGVIGSAGGRYIVYATGSVYALDEPGSPDVVHYCYQPADYLPDGDHMLALKWFIEADEYAFQRGAVSQRCSASAYHNFVRETRMSIHSLTRAIAREREKMGVSRW